ncbi:MAG: efflux RND transporter periplasmic adaptor subunit [Acidobacteriota bacterium]
MTRLHGLVAAVVLVGVTGGLVSLRASREVSELPKTVAVERGELTRELVLDGRLRAASTVSLRPDDWGRLRSVLPEGTAVEAGDVVFSLDADELAVRLEQARREEAIAVSAVEQLVAERAAQARRHELEERRRALSLELATLRAQRAEDDLTRTRRRVARDLVPRAQLPPAERARDEAGLGLSRVELESEQARSESRGKTSALELELLAARAQLRGRRVEVESLRGRVSRAEVRAPRAGVVVHALVRGRPARVGEEVGPHRPVVELPDPSVLRVDVEAHEVDASELRVGQDVVVELPAFPGRFLAGHVAQVGVLAREQLDRSSRPTGRRVVDVVVELNESDERLRPGLSCTARVRLAHHDDALLLPITAIDTEPTTRVVTADGDAIPVVLLDSDGRTAVIESDALEAGRHVRREAGR